jgi:hypothetical protein
MGDTSTLWSEHEELRLQIHSAFSPPLKHSTFKSPSSCAIRLFQRITNRIISIVSPRCPVRASCRALNCAPCTDLVATAEHLQGHFKRHPRPNLLQTPSHPSADATNIQRTQRYKKTVTVTEIGRRTQLQHPSQELLRDAKAWRLTRKRAICRLLTADAGPMSRNTCAS